MAWRRMSLLWRTMVGSSVRSPAVRARLHRHISRGHDHRQLRLCGRPCRTSTPGERPMHPADLNMTTEVIGYGRFLFVSLPEGIANAELMVAIDSLGAGLENMHDAEGPASEANFRRGRF